MSGNNIYVTLVRPGKQAKTVSVLSGTTLEAVLLTAGISSADYAGWNFTDEDGDTLALSDSLHTTTSVVAGPRVDGA